MVKGAFSDTLTSFLEFLSSKYRVIDRNTYELIPRDTIEFESDPTRYSPDLDIPNTSFAHGHRRVPAAVGPADMEKTASSRFGHVMNKIVCTNLIQSSQLPVPLPK